MTTKQEVMRERTKQFAIRVVRLFRALSPTEDARIIGKQLLRSGTSVAANYRAVCRARSHKDFVAKMGTVLEESDESAFWLEMLADTEVLPRTRLSDLHSEAEELTKIFSASYETARARSKKQSGSNKSPNR